MIVSNYYLLFLVNTIYSLPMATEFFQILIVKVSNFFSLDEV
jgi:hypothetical protein